MRWLLPLVLATSVLASDSESCQPIDGIGTLLEPGTILLLGEIHGTEESPAFALQTACHAARTDLPVIVGLELRPAEQARVDAYMVSGGTEDDRRSLLAGSVWQANYQDGRASHAMFDLIDGLRAMRREGREVRVALFDAPGSRGGQQRERDMARNLAAIAADSPRAMTIVLTGNMHSRVTRGNARDSEYEPMGYLLARDESVGRVLSLNVAHSGGSAWVCNPNCGVSRFGGGDDQTAWRIEMDEATRPAGHVGWYHVGAITASVPARISPSEVFLPEPPTRATGRPTTSVRRPRPGA